MREDALVCLANVVVVGLQAVRTVGQRQLEHRARRQRNRLELFQLD